MKFIIVDIDNTIANVNKELEKKGYATNVYPSPIPSDVFDDGTVFREAEPMVSNINLINELVKGNMAIFLTARSKEKHIVKITKEWIEKYTPFSFPLYFTGGKPKGDLLKKIYSNKILINYEWIIFEDSPHEIISYLNFKKEANLNMDLYIPSWKYNDHVEYGKKI